MSIRKLCLFFALSSLLVVISLPIARRAVGQGPIEKRFEQLDTNKDGKVTREELPQAEIFDQFDTNKDGVITRAEATRSVISGAVRRWFRGDSQESSSAPEKPAPQQLLPVRQGAAVLKPSEHGVGTPIPNISFQDIDNVEYRLNQWKNQAAIVVAWTSTSCPISKKYVPTLIDLVNSSPDSVTWILVNPIATDNTQEMQEVVQQFSKRVIYVHDAKGQLTNHFNALTTTDCFILNRDQTVVYHGAVDDQYGFGYSIDEPRHRYLEDALTAILDGKAPFIAATTAPGCSLEKPKTPTTPTDITYHNRISRIMQRHCNECHREGGVGPFQLDTYEDVVAHAGMIEQVIAQGTMPPWFAAPTAAPSETPKSNTPAHVSIWANDRSLGAKEKADLLQWLGGEKALGDASQGIEVVVRSDEWNIGKPDEIFEFAKPVSIKATGTMPYQNVIVETNLPEDKWVQAVEIRPSNPAVVHHVLVFALGSHDPENGTGDDAADERSGYWAIYVPGNNYVQYRDGFARRLPKGAKLRFQMHYTPNGEATTDQTKIGLIYAKEPPQHEVKVVGIVDPRLQIPPGAPNHRAEATLTVPTEAKILGYLPHMHLRGKAARYEITKADGSVSTLLDVPRYDFNWQLLYSYYEPLDVQPGDKIKYIAWYDNSPDNPANPDPTKLVRWGAQTEDEMHLGYVEYYLPNEQPGSSQALRNRILPAGVGNGANIEAIFKRLDRNSDGKVTETEIPAAQRERILRLDSDGDGAITLEEAKRFGR